MHLERCVAIVGRPNVGKSRIFNRLARQRISIVHDQPGVTRDIVSTIVNDDYTLLDTGGLGMGEDLNPARIVHATHEQVDFAIQAASLILFVVAGPEGLLPQDEAVAQRLRRAGKEVILVVNKIDGPGQNDQLHAFHRLGFGTPIGLSAEHKYNWDALETAISGQLGPAPEYEESEEAERPIRICIAGRPNVGKSSLTNALLRSDRLIVSDHAGTTRDCIETDFDYTDAEGEQHPFTLLDTAGLRKKGKFDSSIEYFASMRTENAIESADVAFLVIDATAGFTQQDKKIAAAIHRAGRALVIVVNKWDLAKQSFRDQALSGYDSPKGMRHGYVMKARKEFFFAPDAPIVFVSAKTRYKTAALMDAAIELNERLGQKLPTAAINHTLQELIERHTPNVVHGKRFKIYYATQVGSRPFTLRIFCNQKTRLENSYLNYLNGGLRQAFDLAGCPLILEFIGKSKRSAQERIQDKPKDSDEDLESLISE